MAQCSTQTRNVVWYSMCDMAILTMTTNSRQRTDLSMTSILHGICAAHGLFFSVSMTSIYITWYNVQCMVYFIYHLILGIGLTVRTDPYQDKGLLAIVLYYIYNHVI